jgi:hypothetical protein
VIGAGVAAGILVDVGEVHDARRPKAMIAERRVGSFLMAASSSQ